MSMIRNMGDASWINDYIRDIPFKFGGRDMEDGLDCYGLVKLVYLERFGIVLPDWATDMMTLSEKDKEIQNVVTSGNFVETTEPEDGCFVVCYRSRAAHHMGLYFAGGVLHCSDNGPVYQPIGRFKMAYPNLVFGYWTP